jgi:hypothetical protein
MALMTTASFSDPKSRAIGALWDFRMQDLSSQLRYQEYGFHDFEPDAADEQLQGYWGPARGILTVEGQTYGSNEIYRDYPVTVTLRKYTSRLVITEEDIHWLTKAKQQKHEMQIISMLDNAINALNYNVEFDATRFIYLSHTTAMFTGGDSLSLINTAHPLRSGGTQANNFGSGDTHRAFSASALVELINLMDRFKGQNGTQMLPTKHLRVLCSIEAAPTVQQAIDSKYGPTANLNLSTASAEAFQGRGKVVDFRVMPYMPAAYKNYWFVVAMDRTPNRMLMCWAWKPRLAQDSVISNGTFENDASVSFAPIALGWQFIAGSKGDGSSIS